MKISNLIHFKAFLLHNKNAVKFSFNSSLFLTSSISIAAGGIACYFVSPLFLTAVGVGAGSMCASSLGIIAALRSMQHAKRAKSVAWLQEQERHQEAIESAEENNDPEEIERKFEEFRQIVAYRPKKLKGKKLTLEHLPDPVLMYALSYLEPNDACNALLVNKRFFNLLTDREGIWETFKKNCLWVRKRFYRDMGPTLKYLFPHPERIPTIERRDLEFNDITGLQRSEWFDYLRYYKSPILKGSFIEGTSTSFFFIIGLQRITANGNTKKRYALLIPYYKLVIYSSWEKSKVWEIHLDSLPFPFLPTALLDPTKKEMVPTKRENRNIHLEIWLKKILNFETCGKLYRYPVGTDLSHAPYKELPMEKSGTYRLWPYGREDEDTDT